MSDTTIPQPALRSAPLPGFRVTLENCEREPIHIPGLIQPHGGLVAFSPVAGAILHASTNLEHWLPVGELPTQGRSLADLFGGPGSALVLQALTTTAGGAIRHQIVDLPARPAQGQAEALEVVVHAHRGVCIAEVESACAPEEQLDWIQLFGDTIDALRSASDLDGLVERAAQRVKRLTGFDRVMVYRFDKDWNGHVIADAHEADMESFYDLHYPASDIPAQARELFRSNLVRYIADVGYAPVLVQPWLSAERKQPLDMSHATLRSASPIHIQYLQNMGVGATLTISLLVEDRLWGLIACHHRTPRAGANRLPMRLRRACHALSVTAGYMVGWHEQRQRATELAALTQAQARIVEAFNHVQAPLADVVEQCSAALLRLASARGGACWRDGTVLPFGQWPNGDEGDAILHFAQRALETSTADLSHSDTAFLESADGEVPAEGSGRVCGYMAVRLDAFASSGIVWVRSAIRSEVSWGGDPDKPVQVSLDAAGQAILSPRTSFARWVTIVQGRCLPWTQLDIGAVRSLLTLTPVLGVRDSLAQVSLSDRRFRSLVALQSDAYCQLDVEGHIITLSKALPTGPGAVEGRALSALFIPTCDTSEVEALDRALAGLQPFRDLRLHGRATDGRAEFAVKVGGEPLRNPHGRLIGWHGTITDVTLEGAVLKAGALQNAIFHSANFSSIATDAKGVIQIFNVGAEHMLGYAAGDVVNKITPADISDPQELIDRAKTLTVELDMPIAPGFEALVFKASHGIEDIYELTYIRKDGSRFPAVVSVTALRDAGEAIIGYLLIGTDNTARKLLADELDQHRHHLEELVFSRTAELALSRDAAQAASRAKSMFLANMSHELRTPMNGIMGMTDLALRRATDSKQIEWLKLGAQASRHLLAIINDILDISRIEADQLTLEEKTFSLGRTIDESVRMLEGQAMAKGLLLSREIAATVPDLVVGDALRLKQILLNFIGNAVKFSDRGQIVVRAQTTEDSGHSLLLRIEVADQGIGLSAEQQNGLFRVFSQVDESSTRKYGGSGLGLAISKRLARLMGGDVGVASIAGAGSTFWVTARLKRAVSADLKNGSNTEPLRDMLTRRFAGLRILVAEDDPTSQAVASGLLEDAGLLVDMVGNGREAVAMARLNSYALILLDMKMPVMDGLEAASAIRGLPGMATIPMLAMTANAFPEDRDRCLAAGMDGHIGKPVEPHILYSSLLQWLAKTGMPAAR